MVCIDRSMQKYDYGLDCYNLLQITPQTLVYVAMYHGNFHRATLESAAFHPRLGLKQHPTLLPVPIQREYPFSKVTIPSPETTTRHPSHRQNISFLTAHSSHIKLSTSHSPSATNHPIFPQPNNIPSTTSTPKIKPKLTQAQKPNKSSPGKAHHHTLTASALTLTIRLEN
ncbi:hypothetical protein BDW69DRAFT_161002 [Aspergillus filifer]